VNNTADQLLYTAEKSLKEHGDKAGEDIKKEVQEKIDALKSARGGSDVEALKNATEALSTSLSKIGEAMNKAGAAGAEEPKADTPEEPKQQ